LIPRHPRGEAHLEGADAQLGTDRRREIRRQLDPLLNDGAEACDGKGHLIESRAEVDNRVPALRVGDNGPHLLDECGARGFDRHARQHTAARVLDDARHGALSRDDCRKQREGETGQTEQVSQNGCGERDRKTQSGSGVRVSVYHRGRMQSRTGK
jgi:hypothetical protein